VESSITRECVLPPAVNDGDARAEVYLRPDTSAATVMFVPATSGLSVEAKCWTTREGLERLRDLLNVVLVSSDA